MTRANMPIEVGRGPTPRCQFTDSAIGVVRHADAGYVSADAAARSASIMRPMAGE